jgi:hypothetical protein
MRRRKSDREKQVEALLGDLDDDLVSLEIRLRRIPLRLVSERKRIRGEIADKKQVIRMLQDELSTFR